MAKAIDTAAPNAVRPVCISAVSTAIEKPERGLFGLFFSASATARMRTRRHQRGERHHVCLQGAELMELIKRLMQRLLILGLGIFCVWLIVFVVFETADRRLPWILALSITYGCAAYIVLPQAIRLGLKILHRKRVPSYTITGDGLPGDPVNLALVGTLQQLRSAFAILGWSEADRLGLASSWGMIRAFVLNSVTARFAAR
jgi:hypothetical protein